MEQICNLANTGVSKTTLLYLTGILIIGAVLILALSQERLSIKGLFKITISILFVSTFIVGSSGVAVAQESTQCVPSSNQKSENPPVIQRTWTPEGRFLNSVFDEDDIENQENVIFGTETNFSGDTENLLITINQPKQSLDLEGDRPLVIGFPGGDTMGFCDQTLATEQEAMLELAQYGYVTATVTQLVDPAFCVAGGADGTAYMTNMAINMNVLNKAIQYMYDNASTYKIDPNNTALYGYSIGGQISLFKVRENYNDGPHVKVIAAFAAVAPDMYDPVLSARVPADQNSPSILMVSFEPDTGFGPGMTPDARGDCEFLYSIGYECTFGGLDFASHPVHANSTTPLVISPDLIPVDEYFRNYLYQKMILE